MRYTIREFVFFLVGVRCNYVLGPYFFLKSGILGLCLFIPRELDADFSILILSCLASSVLVAKRK